MESSWGWRWCWCMSFVSSASPTSTSVFRFLHFPKSLSVTPRKQQWVLFCVFMCRRIKWKCRSSEHQEEELLTWLSNLNLSIFCLSGRLCPLQLISPCMLCERWSKMAAREWSSLIPKDENQTQTLPYFLLLNSVGPWQGFIKNFLEKFSTFWSYSISPNFISMPLVAPEDQLFTSWGESCDGDFRWYSSRFANDGFQPACLVLTRIWIRDEGPDSKLCSPRISPNKTFKDLEKFWGCQS